MSKQNKQCANLPEGSSKAKESHASHIPPPFKVLTWQLTQLGSNSDLTITIIIQTSCYAEI